MSHSSTARVETYGRTDRRTNTTEFVTFLANAVDKYSNVRLLYPSKDSFIVHYPGSNKSLPSTVFLYGFIQSVFECGQDCNYSDNCRVSSNNAQLEHGAFHQRHLGLVNFATTKCEVLWCLKSPACNCNVLSTKTAFQHSPCALFSRSSRVDTLAKFDHHFLWSISTEHFDEIRLILSWTVPKIWCVEKCATFWAILYAYFSHFSNAVASSTINFQFVYATKHRYLPV